MLTPEEVAGHAFAKATFGGYNMGMVDEFLDELTDDYTALYKENTALKAKMKVLVDRVEEYRATEDSMRSALLAAQKMASSMVSEAEEKKESMIAGAEVEARAKIGALEDEIAYEQKRLSEIKAATKRFLERARALYEDQMRQLEAFPDLIPDEIRQAGEAAGAENDAANDIAAIGERIVSSYDAEAADAPTKTIPPVPAGAARSGAGAAENKDGPRSNVDLFNTRRVTLSDLKYARNYRSGENS